MKNAVLLEIIGAVAPKDVALDIANIIMDEKLAANARRDARNIQNGADRNVNKLLEKVGVKKAEHNGCRVVSCPHCGQDVNAPTFPKAEAVAVEVSPRGWDKV